MTKHWTLSLIGRLSEPIYACKPSSAMCSAQLMFSFGAPWCWTTWSAWLGFYSTVSQALARLLDKICSMSCSTRWTVRRCPNLDGGGGQQFMKVLMSNIQVVIPWWRGSLTDGSQPWRLPSSWTTTAPRMSSIPLAPSSSPTHGQYRGYTFLVYEVVVYLRRFVHHSSSILEVFLSNSIARWPFPIVVFSLLPLSRWE